MGWTYHPDNIIGRHPSIIPTMLFELCEAARERFTKTHHWIPFAKAALLGGGVTPNATDHPDLFPKTRFEYAGVPVTSRDVFYGIPLNSETVINAIISIFVSILVPGTYTPAPFWGVKEDGNIISFGIWSQDCVEDLRHYLMPSDTNDVFTLNSDIWSKAVRLMGDLRCFNDGYDQHVRVSTGYTHRIVRSGLYHYVYTNYGPNNPGSTPTASRDVLHTIYGAPRYPTSPRVSDTADRWVYKDSSLQVNGSIKAEWVTRDIKNKHPSIGRCLISTSPGGSGIHWQTGYKNTTQPLSYPVINSGNSPMSVNGLTSSAYVNVPDALTLSPDYVPPNDPPSGYTLSSHQVTTGANRIGKFYHDLRNLVQYKSDTYYPHKNDPYF